jgi:hypothetical protein
VVTVPSIDFASLQAFTTYDEEAVVKLAVKVEGDVTVSALHARQSFGGQFNRLSLIFVPRITNQAFMYLSTYPHRPL